MITRTMLVPAKTHFVMVKMAVSHATVAGVDGWIESMVTMPRFSNRSNSHAPKGITFSFCILLLASKALLNNHEINKLKNNVYTTG